MGITIYVKKEYHKLYKDIPKLTGLTLSKFIEKQVLAINNKDIINDNLLLLKTKIFLDSIKKDSKILSIYDN